ncbi:MAG: hypothetical protein FD166_171 [Bacteroidetes bacterium]|nr:MAG: hypothetical protein FD166_171 [Bacteroidota bacterium]
MRKQLYLFATLLVILSGCSKENELKKSVMIYDPEFIDLPVYSEWGYNTFGAYYDREVFISDDITVPAKVVVSDGAMSFVLNGHKGAYYYYDESNRMNLTLRLPGFTPDSYSDMIILNDTVFDLTNPDCQVVVESAGNPINTFSIISGAFQFKRAQNLLVDKQQVEVILSGYFELKALINGQPVTISDGRFDVGIGPDNFYIY